ncbi:mitochondrial Rho GTPase 1-like [Dorcoceras hygrometricum]|uniref:Mitochondrial Rho GTPase 1-like n=1 Tax=Dorcoceras hygrometricum TaxID=472368 RepID=A0A2Z7A2D5_9LAMI|nr:mitochondrial Rho GTPase 1-like [Dorcoceras hygrometricum]
MLSAETVMRAMLNENAESLKNTIQYAVIFVYGSSDINHPTSPLLPPRKDPLLHNCTSAATV